ncbi:MAG: hypothetical protein AB1650_04730 [Candidatus Omnitrophota bacterium]
MPAALFAEIFSGIGEWAGTFYAKWVMVVTNSRLKAFRAENFR